MWSRLIGLTGGRGVGTVFGIVVGPNMFGDVELSMIVGT